MLRRLVFVGIAGVLLFSALACSSFADTASRIPFLQRGPRAIGTAIPDNTTSVALNQEAETTQPVVSPVRFNSTPAAEARGAMTQVDESNQTATPTIEWLMLPAGVDSTPAPTLIIRFNTPTPMVEVMPTALLPQPTAGLPPTSADSGPVVITLPAPPPTATPIPIIISPAPSPVVPLVTASPPVPETGGAVAGTAPEIIWIDDEPGWPRSKVMGWRGGVSYSLFGDKNYISRVLEFNVSPRGDWLAYTTIDSSGIRQVNTTTGEQREIKPKYAWWCYRFPAWSPDGTLLAFVAGADSAPWVSPPGAGLWTSAPDGSNIKQVVDRVGWANQRILLAGWHPFRNELIYALPNLPGALLPEWFVVALDSGSPQALPLKGTLYDVAPDGSWLLGDGFTKNWPEGRQEHSFNVLMRVPVDGATPQVLTPACRSDIMGQISPDGSRIAFLSMPTIGPFCPPQSGPITYELWVMNSDGSGRRQIPVEGFVGRNSPQWSPDGMYIYCCMWDNTGSALWKADASGATPGIKLPQTEGADRFAVVR